MKEEFLGLLAQMGVEQLIAAYQTADALEASTEASSLKSRIVEHMQQYIYKNGGEGTNRFTAVTGYQFRSYGDHMCESL